jgi:hypothetical protein
MDSSTDIMIGAVSGANSNFFDGIITEVSLWNSHFSLAQVQELFNDGVALDATAHSVYTGDGTKLRGYWRNDGISSWSDRSDYSNPATPTNATDTILLPEGTTAGKDILGFPLTHTNNGWLNLSGSEYVDVSDSDALDIGEEDFSIEAWIKTSAQGHMRIIDKKDASTGWLLSINTSEQLNYVLDDTGGDATYTGSTNISDGNWHHVVISADRSGNGIIYLDKAVDSTDDISARSALLDSTSSIFIGADAPSGDSLFFDGSIDEVRVYKGKALTLAEVTKNYKHGKSKHS